MESYGEDLGTGRYKHAGVGGIFQGGVTGGSSLFVVSMGDDPLHGPVPGGFQHIVARRIMGRKPWWLPNGS